MTLKTLLGFKKTASPAAEAAPGALARLGNALTRTGLGDWLGGLRAGTVAVDADLLELLEERLLSADVGVEVTEKIMGHLGTRLGRRELRDAGALADAVREELLAILRPCEQPLVIAPDARPFILLMVGINGAGKTTTIGKLAQQLRREGRQVMLAAGDTFRAAAVEQLQAWAERNQMPVIVPQSAGADPAAVIHDAVEAARARRVDVLIADTSGRLHTQANLMEELKKIKRVISRADPAAPQEVMLVLDAGTGQNALMQAQQFHQAVGLTGITLTKLDGTAKGGIIFALAEKVGVPIRYIGVGEGADDLRVFNANEFVEALLEKPGGENISG
ncbi:MAG: signal recognition particle-docking protein FtsY [Gammaproteobacteria bacterium]|nr:signal recognition particle-docking protein FtsY [Gammaproteobacteria bacterium]